VVSQSGTVEVKTTVTSWLDTAMPTGWNSPGIVIQAGTRPDAVHARLCTREGAEYRVDLSVS
jgi:hypothetical protein